MLSLGNSTSIWKLRIPTIVGLVFLVIALMLGTFFFSQGTGVFAPRATPQTTPKNIRITNISDTSFTVSFMTDEPTTAFVKYGSAANNLETEVHDDRDQLSGKYDTKYPLHHISILGLQPATKYYFVISTGDGAMFDNNGSNFEIMTAQRNGAPSSAKTIYGSVTTETGSPAEGAIVYVKIPGAGDMSSLVKKSNSWAIPLSNARTVDGSAYTTVAEDAELLIAVQGIKASDRMEYKVMVKNAQPVPELQFGQSPAAAATTGSSTSSSTATTSTTSAKPSSGVNPASSTASSSSSSAQTSSTGLTGTLMTPPSASQAGQLSTVLSEQGMVKVEESVNTDTTINLEDKSKQDVVTSQPTFVGTAAPNTEITIEVHSENQILTKVTSDSSGKFNLDLSKLSQNLEPGEHTVKYTYVDPASGQTISDLINFTVYAAEDPAYGTNNPYPVTTTPSPTKAATASATPAASASATPTKTITPTKTATGSSRVSVPSTGSAVPVSGSVDTTLLLIAGGLFFIIAGGWSYWISLELTKRD